MEALIARAVQILIALGGAYFLTLWFALVVWTFQDIQARSRSVVAQIFSTLVVMIFSIPGLLVYLILRPRYTLDDAFQRSLEEEYIMQDLEELPLCPSCQQYVEDEWVYCPNCRTELRDNCIACDRLIDLGWEICPYCGTEQYEDSDYLPAPPVQPVLTPSPQFLGRPQLTPVQAFELSSSSERTRPIIPATVRVDLRSGSIAMEEVPELPISVPLRSSVGAGAPRRVTIDHVNGQRGGEPKEVGNASRVTEAEVVATADEEPDDSTAEAAGNGEPSGEPVVQETETETATEADKTENPTESEAPTPKKRPRKRRARKPKAKRGSARRASTNDDDG